MAKAARSKSISKPEAEALAVFRKRNPSCRVQHDRKGLSILQPWNDSTLILSIADEEVASLGLLNDLILPERFNAIYHYKEAKLEFIFNALFDKDEPSPSSPFQFQFMGKAHSCWYGEPTTHLCYIARVAKPVHTSAESAFRNLTWLKQLQEIPRYSKRLRDAWADARGISFFIDGIESYDEEQIVRLAKHLNFYISYFDRESPQIQILGVSSPEAEVDELPLQRSLPSIITAHELDQFLLDLNLAARDVDVRLRFLYYYQILEYAAFYWIEDSVKAGICKILKAPDLQARVDDYFPKLIEALGPTRQQDEQKIRKVIEVRVEPLSIWNEIKRNLPFFSSEQQFDGGFRLTPLISRDSTEDSFVKMWSPKVFDVIRAIRNALVHARESRMHAVIYPTVSNDVKLKPFLPLMRLIAEQVTIFEE